MTLLLLFGGGGEAPAPAHADNVPYGPGNYERGKSHEKAEKWIVKNLSMLGLAEPPPPPPPPPPKPIPEIPQLGIGFEGVNLPILNAQYQRPQSPKPKAKFEWWKNG
jgi:hypothetical protein